jgi:hypothetical protein
MLFETIEPALPERAVQLEPGDGILQWLRFHAAPVDSSFPFLAYEAGISEHGNVFGNSLLRYLEGLDEL